MIHTSNNFQISCYKADSSPLPQGISFQVTPRRQFFIHYAWLLSIELIDSSELVFSFNSAKIRVIGENLAPIYEAATAAKLCRIWLIEQPPDAMQSWVSQIILESDAQEGGEQTPAFPREP